MLTIIAAITGQTSYGKMFRMNLEHFKHAEISWAVHISFRTIVDHYDEPDCLLDILLKNCPHEDQVALL